MRRNRRIRGVATAVTGGALALSLLAATPRITPTLSPRDDAPLPDRAPLVRSAGEAIQDFSIRLDHVRGRQVAGRRRRGQGDLHRAARERADPDGQLPDRACTSGCSSTAPPIGPAGTTQWTRPAWQLKENPYNGRTNAIVTMRMVQRRGLGRVGGRRLLSRGPPQPLKARLGGW